MIARHDIASIEVSGIFLIHSWGFLELMYNITVVVDKMYSIL